jgi:hypothetical protein
MPGATLHPFRFRSHPTPPDNSPRESERLIFREGGLPDPNDAQPRDFLALVVESITLSIAAASEELSQGLPWDFNDRVSADRRIEALESLLRDRRALLAAYDGFGPVPRLALERHGWLAIEEARLNVRDAPDWWPDGRVEQIEQAAERGAEWLEAAGLPEPMHAPTHSDARPT